MLRWKTDDLIDWKWEPLRAEFETHLPLRWHLLQHMAANPRDIELTFAPRTNAYELVRAVCSCIFVNTLSVLRRATAERLAARVARKAAREAKAKTKAETKRKPPLSQYVR